MTHSRHEQVLYDALSAMGVWCFFPKYEVLRVYQHRKVRRRLPLFPGYLFLYGDLESVYSADRNPHTVGFLKVPDQEQLHGELRQIAEALASEVPCAPHPELTQGRDVVVSEGPLMGMQGVVDARMNRPDRLVLRVRMLGQAVGLEIDADVLEPKEAELELSA